MGALRKFVAMRIESRGDAPEKCASCSAAGLGIDGESVGGELGGAIELLRGGSTVNGLDGFAGAGGEGLEAGAVARAAFGADEGKTGEFHDCFSVVQR